MLDVQTGRFIEYNDQACHGLGYTREEFSCLSVDDFQMEHSPEIIQHNIAQVAAGRTVQFETRHRRKNGCIQEADVRLIPISSNSKPFICVVWRDITEQKQKEHEQQTLARRLQDKALTIRKISCLESGINGELERFARDMSELLSLEMAIDEVSVWMIDASETTMHCDASYNRQDHSSRVGKILGKALFDAMRSLLNDKHFIQIDSSTQDPDLLVFKDAYLEKDGFDAFLACEIQSQGIPKGFLAFGMYQHFSGWNPDDVLFCGQCADQIGIASINEERLRITKELLVDLDHIPRVIRGDSNRLRQILLNIASNAVKFTGNGFIAIRGTLLHRTADRLQVRFEIEDSGIGMKADQLARLFNEFEQGDVSTTRLYGGTGLGMAISKKLAELMGGVIGVRSELGRGSTFWVELPFETSTKIPENALYLQSITGSRVLIIDDLEDARTIVAAMTSQLGLRTDLCDSGSEGLNLIRQADQESDPYQVVIVDLKMPALDGLETAHLLKSAKLVSPPQVVLMTSYAAESSEIDLEQEGIARILIKPLTISVLNDALTDLLMPLSVRSLAHNDKLYEAIQTRRGARILLAEDNQVNQEVTCQLLEAFGATIEIAENGLEALEMVKKRRYDLILMDVQMPVMDGLQATAAIRQLPGWQTVPIIAMTANAYGEDRQKCLNAGMNDHLPKPVSPDLLYGMLINWLEPVQRNAEDPTRALRSEPSTSQPQVPHPFAARIEQLSAIPGLDVVAGLQMLQGDQDLYIRITGQFVDLHEHESTKILQALQNHDLKTIQHVAHTLRGSAGTLGAKAIQEAAAGLEIMARANQDPTDPAYAGQIEHLAAALSAVAQGYRMAVEDRDASTSLVKSAPEDPDHVRHVLQELHRLLLASDAEVNEQIVQVRALLFRSMGDDAQVLENQILNFDYTDALRTLEQHLKS